jgi:hypothetical protein
MRKRNPETLAWLGFGETRTNASGPSRFVPGLQKLGWPSRSAIESCSGERNLNRFNRLLTMLDSVRNYAQGQRFRLSDRFFTTLPILQHTGNLRNLGDPSPSSSRSVSTVNLINYTSPMLFTPNAKLTGRGPYKRCN